MQSRTSDLVDGVAQVIHRLAFRHRVDASNLCGTTVARAEGTIEYFRIKFGACMRRQTTGVDGMGEEEDRKRGAGPAKPVLLSFLHHAAMDFKGVPSPFASVPHMPRQIFYYRL
jgi:hypothetical protein